MREFRNISSYSRYQSCSGRPSRTGPQTCTGPHAQAIQPHKIFINEPGLYEFLSTSTKPLARIFMDKYFINIMPTIRKTGKYVMDKLNKQRIKIYKIIQQAFNY